jgi:hypothetical protein
VERLPWQQGNGHAWIGSVGALREAFHQGVIRLTTLQALIGKWPQALHMAYAYTQ